MDWHILQKVLASIFIISLVILQLSWCLPEGYLARKIIYKLLYKQVVWCGLDHYWALFAPEPVFDIFVISFKIEFTDGSSLPWQLSDFKSVNKLQQLKKTRDLKYYYSLLSTEEEAAKKGICSYILDDFQRKNSQEKLPSLIHIVHHYKPRGLQNFTSHPWLVYKAYTFSGFQHSQVNT